MQSDNELKNWPVIGKGTERICLQDPDDSSQCVKLSEKSSAKQTYREIIFFEKLKNKNTQFTHIPEYLGKVLTETKVGFKQQVILDEDNKISLNLAGYIVQQGKKLDIDKLLFAILTLKNYLVSNRIIPSDLVLTNLLVKQSKKGITVYLIDGFGNTEFIPVSDFIPYLRTKKIKRKFKRFLTTKLQPFLNGESTTQESTVYNKKIKEFSNLYL